MIPDDITSLPSKVNLGQIDVSTLSPEKIRELFRSGKLPTPETITDEVILQAVKVGATDVHFEPGDSQLRIRIGRDGALKRLVALPRDLSENLASVLKTKASMNAFEKKKPQEGRFSVTLASHPYDIRVSTIPTLNGERVALRVLQKSSHITDIGELGFSPENHAMFIALLRKPSGLMLVTGPSGSGKTTTVYAAVNELQSTDKNIFTVENPIEYKLESASQVTAAGDAGFSYADALRSILRHNPNIVMLGEIRNAETGTVAAEAALTGILLLSTMLSGDAVGAIARLLNLGITPYWIASTLIGVVYQQLVRTICPSCKEGYKPSPEEVQRLSHWISPPAELFRGKGCVECEGTGFFGRTGIHEVLATDDTLRDLVYQQASMQRMREAAIASGFETIQIDAARKVGAGITTVGEFVRALG